MRPSSKDFEEVGDDNSVRGSGGGNGGGGTTLTDNENIFLESHPEYITVTESLTALQKQLQQAQLDIQQLYELKSQALSEPEIFLNLFLEDKVGIPQIQTVTLIPDLRIGNLVRRGRRPNSRYEQNLEYLRQRILDLQNKKGDLSLIPDRTLLSTPIKTESPWYFEDENGALAVRRRFKEIAGMGINRAASAPALYSSTSRTMNIENNILEIPDMDRNIFSPQPMRTSSVQFTMPFLPLGSEASRLSSPTLQNVSNPASHPSSSLASVAATPPKNQNTKRKKLLRTSESAHHNLPWTEEEKRRLEELLEIYPEEEINSRRYAKIAAAIGTRTPGQVANRLNKLQIKKRRKAIALEEKFIDPGNEPIDKLLDKSVKNSADYQEYQLLKKQVELLESDPTIPVHVGFKCDSCGMEPIVGPRWRCTKCLEPNAIDLCKDCYKEGAFRTKIHKPTHRFMQRN